MFAKLKKRGTTFVALTAMLLATGFTALPTGSAEAGWRGGYGGGGYYGHRNYNAGAAVAAGIIGLAAGALIGSALSQPRYQPQYYPYAAPGPVYVVPPAPVYVVPPQPVYVVPPAQVYVVPARPVYVTPGRVMSYDPSVPVNAGNIQAGTYAPSRSSADWNAYCASKYRSFNPATGMFMGYDGQRHYCR